MKPTKITLITDRKITKNSIIARVSILSKLGLARVIIREKDLQVEALHELYMQIKKNITTPTQVFVNAGEEFINKYNVDQIHLSQYNFHSISKTLLKNIDFGISVHSVKQAQEALVYQPSYLLVSHIFKTPCKKGVPPKGIHLLETIKKVTNVPIVALGGITSETSTLVRRHGFSEMAIRSYLLKSEEIEKDYYKLFDE